ncbi:MAG: caspase family protein [Candidatus Methanomethylicaceae archaeon]
MVRWSVTTLILLCLVTPSSPAQERRGSAMDIVVQARERLNPGIGRDELERILGKLKVATDMYPTFGDAWYYRYLCEKKLGNQPAADYALKKAQQYGSEALKLGYDPFEFPKSDRISTTVRDKWALVVGIAQFADRRINPLNYTTKDAKDFAALLTSRDYGRFNPDHVRVLVDKGATTKAIKESLNWLARNAKEDDLVVIYLSSHGSPREMDTAGVSYVITYDTDVSNPDSLYATALPMVDLADAVRTRIKAQRVVVLLDACYSEGAIPIGISKDALNRIRQGIGRVIITSSRADERSWESERLKNGYFTYYLIEGLKQNNGFVPIEEVYNYLKDKVSQQVRREKGASQNPVMSKSEQTPEIIIGIDTEASRADTAPERQEIGAKDLYLAAKYVGIYYWIELEGVGPVPDDRVFRTGDRIRLYIRSNADGYLSLWKLDSSGRGQSLFPAPGGFGIPVKANRDYTHPNFITMRPTDRLVIFFSRSKADIPVLTGKEKDAQTVAEALNPKGERALVFEEEIERQGANEVGTYVVNKNQGLLIKEIRLKLKE